MLSFSWNDECPPLPPVVLGTSGIHTNLLFCNFVMHLTVSGSFS